jgi:hypothetical protein
MAEKWVSPNQQRRLARIPEDKRDDLRAGIGSLAEFSAGMTPGLSDAMTARDAYGAASEGSYGTAALLAALAAIGLVPGVGHAVSAMGKTALRNVDLMRRPKVENVVVYPQIKAPEEITALDRMLERPMTSKEQATHASRDMRNAELYDMLQRGYMLPEEGGTMFSSTQNPQKWFSPRDEAGIFGRPWVGRGEQTVRLPMDKLPSNRAVRASETEVYDRARKTFVPFNEFMEEFLSAGPPNLNAPGFGAGAMRRRAKQTK